MQAVEEYATEWRTEWQVALRQFVLSDFCKFLRDLGSLDAVQGKEHHSTALSWLYYYLGVASLDEAERTGQLK
jgi:hypothetical protein